MHRGITPTFTLTLPEDIDLTYASNVYVTFKDRKGKNKITKTGTALTIGTNTIQVYLGQEETLSLSDVFIQVNWTYQEGGLTKRAASEVAAVHFKPNLEEGVLA